MLPRMAELGSIREAKGSGGQALSTTASIRLQGLSSKMSCPIGARRGISETAESSLCKVKNHRSARFLNDVM